MSLKHFVTLVLFQTGEFVMTIIINKHEVIALMSTDVERKVLRNKVNQTSIKRI